MKNLINANPHSSISFGLRKYISFLLVAVMMTAGGCDKYSNESGIFMVCKVNGKRWKSKGDMLHAEWSGGGKFFNIAGYDGDLKSDISIALIDSISSIQTGTHVLNRNVQAAKYGDYNKSYRYHYETDSLNTGVINFSFAGTKLTGTFSFRAKFATSDEVVNITDGKFSLVCDKR